MLSTHNLISIDDLYTDDVINIFERAEFYKKSPKKIFDELKNIFIVNLFFEPSTRTRFSFELAAKKLSANVINFDPGTSSQTKGETVLDTFNTLVAMEIDGFIIRHKEAGISKMLADNSNKIIINAGDGNNEHPSQALLDAFTLKERLKNLKGKSISIVGDIAHSRVASSNVSLLRKLGMDVKLCAPKSFLPEKKGKWDLQTHDNINEAMENSDAIMLLRIQKERMGESEIPDLNEFRNNYSVSKKLYENHPEKLVMHPGPVNYGIELEEAVTRFDNCLIQTQVNNGLYIRMAILSTLFQTRKGNS